MTFPYVTNHLSFFPSMNWLSISMGTGKIMVEFFSADRWVRVWRYLSCRAALLVEMTSEAILSASEAFISPSAAMILALASRVASASAAMARCMGLGRLTSFTSTRWTLEREK